MKKYYCPRCGKKTLSIFDKMTVGPRTTFGSRLKCSVCGNEIFLRGNIFTFVFIGIFVLSVVLVIFLKPVAPLSYLIVCVTLLLSLLCSTLSIKFIKQEEANDKYYHCNLAMTDNVKIPTLYFSTTSVVLLLFENSAVPIPVLIEPIEINSKSCKCKIAFVLEKPTEEIAGKAFILIDNDKTVGNGHFDK